VHFALVCLGGAVGTGARYLLGGLAIRWFGGEFPYGTLLVNVIGSFFIGLVQGLIFSLLVLIYFVLATESHEEHGETEHALEPHPDQVDMTHASPRAA